MNNRNFEIALAFLFVILIGNCIGATAAYIWPGQ